MSILDDAYAHVDAMVADAIALIHCESPSEDRAAIERSADVTARVLGSRLAAAGLRSEPERVVVDGVPHLRWALGDGPRRVLLLGHHDTVWPVGSLDRLGAGVTGGASPGEEDVSRPYARPLERDAGAVRQVVDGSLCLEQGRQRSSRTERHR